MSDLITISSSVFPASTRVAAFRGREAISRPYEIEIFLLVQSEPGEELDLADALGAKAKLVIDRSSDDVPPFVFTGILAHVELVHEIEGRSLVRAVMVPRLWELGLSKHSRVFTKMTVPDILKTVLEDNGITSDDYEMRLGSYEPEEHVCQYRESDLDFISRWMEREGIYYYFEHGDSGEKLILCDDSAYEEEELGKPVRYWPQMGEDRSARASFRSFRSVHATLPASVKLKDYDYLKPSLEVSGSAPVASNGTAEVSVFGARFFTPSEGDRLAKLRAEELLARQVVFHAVGTRYHLRAGRTFELEDHPRGSFNTKYLVIEALHTGNQAKGLAQFRHLLDVPGDDVYLVELSAIPAKTQFRPESRTPWPRIYGYELAVVDGPADSEYAQVDAQGRYNVKIKFDESTLKDGNASTFLRMMQPHGGGIEGFHFPLRKGTEVLLSFLGGDPDRPVISGVVNNAHTPSPVTSGNHTKNVIQTGGRNRLEIEDLAGQQRITLSTPHANTYLRMGHANADHEMILKTDQRGIWDTGSLTDFRIHGYWDVEVGKYWDIDVVDYKKEVIHGKVEEKYLVTKNEDVPNGKVTEHYKEQEKTVDTTCKETLGKHETHVKGDRKLDIDANQTIHVKGDRKLTVDGNRNDIVVGNVVVNVTQNYTQNVTANYTQIVNANHTTNITANYTIACAGNKQETTGGNDSWLKVGSQNDFVIINKNEGVIGLHTETNVGVKIETFVGAKIGLCASTELKIGAAVDLECVPFKCNALQTRAEAIANWVGCAAITVLGGMKII